MNSDQLQRFIFEELDVRGELVTLTDSWQSILAIQDYPQEIKQALGHAIAAVALLSATIKYEGSLIMQIQGSGPINTLIAQAAANGDLRGLARWKDPIQNDTEHSHADLQSLFGQGRIVISVSNPEKEPYQSIVALQGENLSNALESYFLESEQLASRFWLFVSDQQVAGLFLQQLPSEHSDQEDWDRVCTLATTTTEEEIFTLAPKELLHRLFHEEKVRTFDPTNLQFKCSCSSQKIESTLFSLGKNSLEEALEELGVISVDCDFCNQTYQFSREDIEALFSQTNTTDLKH